MIALLSKAFSADQSAKAIPSISERHRPLYRNGDRAAGRSEPMPARRSARAVRRHAALGAADAWFCVPLLRLTVANGLDDRGIDHGVFAIIRRAGFDGRGRIRQPSPVAVALEACSSSRRYVKMTPGTSCPRDPPRRLDKAPVVTAAAARPRGFAQTIRLHLGPLASVSPMAQSKA